MMQIISTIKKKPWTIIRAIRNQFRLWKAQEEFRRNNAHNSIKILNMFDTSVVTVGKKSYGSIRVFQYGSNAKLKIGSFCSFSYETTFLLEADHRIDTLSQFPFKVECLGEPFEATTKGDIVIEDDVWIGYRSTILSGVHIGRGAVIAAGSTVVKNVPPYAVVGGVPARIIKYRFNENVINKLLKLDYNLLTDDVIESNALKLYENLNDENIDEIVEMIMGNTSEKSQEIIL